MDSRKENSTNDRRREEALARRMGEALDRTSSGKPSDCPDAEMIAAFHEQTLAPEEIGQCENHLAGCSRCRKILAVLAASSETPLGEEEVQRLGELVGAARSATEPAPTASTKHIRPTERWDWRTRWLAPAIGVAAVLAVWFATRPPWRAQNKESASTLVAQAPKSEIRPNSPAYGGNELSKTEPETNREMQRLAPRDPSSVGALDSTGEKPTPSGNVAGSAFPHAETATNALPLQKGLGRPAADGAAPAGVPPAPSISKMETNGPTVQAEARIGGSADASKSARQALSEPTAPASAITSEGAPQAVLRSRNSQEFSVLKENAAPTALMKTPASLVLWRGGKQGSIERSEDGGQTWAAQISPSHEDWLGVAKVSNQSAWIAGRNGAIARTTDGEHWQSVPSPVVAGDSTGHMPDWITISARDAQTATVTARDGRKFTTQDGGKTWLTER